MENAHIVGRFDRDLNNIKARILEMGDLVISQIKDATGALQNTDTAKVDRLVATDRQINGMNKDIHTRAERLIALRQPMALDLRQALSPINIAAELERIGDHAKSTAKRSYKLADAPKDQETLQIVRQMSAMVQAMLTDILVAYNNSDIELAAKVRALDLEVDKLNKAAFAAALRGIFEDPQMAEIFVHLILLARNFERVGDHVVNIARHVHQIVTGEDLKASDQRNCPKPAGRLS